MMEKEIQRKKKVLIDLTNYGSLTAGFGQIAANYAAAFSSMPVEDLHFVYLLRQKYMQEFGSNVTSVPVRRINKFFPFTLPKVDVWHAVNQQRKLLRIAGGTKFIFTIHDFNFLTEKKPWKAKMYLRRMQNKVNKAAVVTTISHYVADVIRQHIDLKGKEIRVIYNGVERIDMLEGTQPSFATGRPFFFTIGQIRRKKNFHLLVDVMRHFPEYDLYICGDAHFAYAEEVRNLIREKQVTNVFLTDVITQSEKIWLYRSCEPFTVPHKNVIAGTLNLLQDIDCFWNQNHESVTVRLCMFHYLILVCNLISDFFTDNMQIVDVDIIVPFQGNQFPNT